MSEVIWGTSGPSYTPASTLICPGAVSVELNVLGNGAAGNEWVAVQLAPPGLPGRPAWSDNPEEFLQVGRHSFERRCDGVRFRSHVGVSTVGVVATRSHELDPGR